jgi:cysteine desulfurase
MKQIYLDYSATTPVKPEVLDAMLPYFTEFYGNPSSLYDLSYPSKDAIAEARGQVAGLINCDPSELFFTSCGSESDNWALFGVADAQRKKGGHIITT